jgi:pimeloyl-ACP methyl ester carboxylesterase
MTFAICLALTFGTAPPESKADPAPGPVDRLKKQLQGVPSLGGRKFWADVYLFRDFRIQQWLLSDTTAKYFRLLDGDDRVIAMGSEDECLAKLAALRREQKLEPLQGKAVVLLHGLARDRMVMRPLGEHLRSAGFTPYYVGYPFTELTIPEHAENLRRIVARLQGPNEIHFVAHSMGGLIVRRYLAAEYDPRVGRVVMIGTPNQGAELADWLKPLSKVLGPAGRQLGKGDAGIVASLPATLPVEFGIIAGGTSDDKGKSPLPGNDDGVVTVASTRLAGARDFAIVNAFHARLVKNDQVHTYAASFLANGYFVAADKRQPIPHLP